VKFSFKPLGYKVLAGLALLLVPACGGSGSSDAPVVSPAIVTEPGNVSVKSGAQALFQVKATGNPSPTYAWERSNDAGQTWVATGGASSSVYAFVTQYTVDNAAQFRVRVSNTAGTVLSSVATLGVTPNIYLGGYGTRKTTTPGPVLYENGAFVTLPVTGTTSSSSVSAVATSGPNVYAAGSNSTLPGYWLNEAWTPLALPTGATGGDAFAVALSGSDLYVGGRATSPGAAGLSGAPGYWVNGKWTALTGPGGSTSGNVYSLVISGTNVYAGGLGAAGGAGYWLNGTWVPLTLPTGMTGAQIQQIVLSGTSVYVLAATSGTGPVGYWLNGTWTALPVPTGYASGAAYSLLVAGANVYVCGSITNNSGKLPGYWLNGSWMALTLPVGATGGQAGASVYSGGVVYISGTLQGAGGGCGYWQNGSWIALSTYQDTINTMLVD
jgi:hypothetical protein